jgi:predicted HD phosphohydrolase
LGLFDGVIQQGQAAFDQEFTQKLQPMFLQLVNELQADRQGDQQLHDAITALEHTIQASTVMQRAMLAQMRAVNAHPKVAPKKPAGAA